MPQANGDFWSPSIRALGPKALGARGPTSQKVLVRILNRLQQWRLVASKLKCCFGNWELA